MHNAVTVRRLPKQAVFLHGDTHSIHEWVTFGGFPSSTKAKEQKAAEATYPFNTTAIFGATWKRQEVRGIITI